MKAVTFDAIAPLEEAGRALEKLKAGGVSGAKVLEIRPSSSKPP